MAERFPNLAKQRNLRSWVNLKWDKVKEIYTKTHYYWCSRKKFFLNLERSNRETIYCKVKEIYTKTHYYWCSRKKIFLNLERSNRETIYCHRITSIQTTANFSSETTETKRKGTTFFKRWKKEMSTMNSISSKTILQEQRGNPDILRCRKTKRNYH